jgi:parallel beta-helix repeat protein
LPFRVNEAFPRATTGRSLATRRIDSPFRQQSYTFHLRLSFPQASNSPFEVAIMYRFLANAFSLRSSVRSVRSTRRPRLECLEDRLTPSTLLVDDNLAQNPKAKFTSIQAAINAAHSGDDIRVYPGTYAEQLTIGAGKNGLTIEAATGTVPLVAAPATLTGNDALVTISSSQNVRIEGLSIQGNASAEFGIRVDTGASATLEDNKISSILGANGAGIFVGQSSPADTTSGHATIEGNKISNYGKVGIAVNGTKYRADIGRNTVVGIGDTGTVAQNGIQIADGASGDIERNDVSGNRYTGTAANGFDATGILVSGAGGHTQVEGNQVHANQVGILIYRSKGVEVDGDVSYKNTADGISIVDSANTAAYFDQTFQNAGDGISVYGGDPAHPSVGNLIALVSSHDNAGNGIYLEKTSKFTLLGNATNSNGANGIFLNDADHGSLLGNAAGRNGLSGIAVTSGSSSNQISVNDTDRNKRDGIELSGSMGDTVTHNDSDSNGRYGISETEPDTSVDNTYANNSADHNAVADFFPKVLDVKKKPK